MLGACKQKKQTDDIITTKYVPKKPGAPIRMQKTTLTDNVSWGGQSYEVKIVREPADSLPMAKNEIGQQYVDNRIALTITRSGNTTPFFSRTFSRASFASYLTGDYSRNSLLANMRMRGVEASELTFTVAIAPPDATDDEFLPLKLSINRNGGIAIKVEDDMEMLAEPQ